MLLLFVAGPMDITLAKQSANVGAILQCFYPAQAAGESLLRVLAVSSTGQIVSPAARMPYTWPASLDQVCIFLLGYKGHWAFTDHVHKMVRV